MKILWLASWYPSKNDMLTGDFFQRHAKAASLHFTIDVLHIKRDDAIAIPIDKNIYHTHRSFANDNYMSQPQKIRLLCKNLQDIGNNNCKNKNSINPE